MSPLLRHLYRPARTISRMSSGSLIGSCVSIQYRPIMSTVCASPLLTTGRASFSATCWAATAWVNSWLHVRNSSASGRRPWSRMYVPSAQRQGWARTVRWPSSRALFEHGRRARHLQVVGIRRAEHQQVRQRLHHQVQLHAWEDPQLGKRLAGLVELVRPPHAVVLGEVDHVVAVREVRMEQLARRGRGARAYRRWYGSAARLSCQNSAFRGVLG